MEPDHSSSNSVKDANPSFPHSSPIPARTASTGNSHKRMRNRPNTKLNQSRTEGKPQPCRTMKGTAEATGRSMGKSKRSSTATSRGAGAAIEVHRREGGLWLGLRLRPSPPVPAALSASGEAWQGFGVSVSRELLNRWRRAERTKPERGEIEMVGVGCRCLVGPRVRGARRALVGWAHSSSPVVWLLACFALGTLTAVAKLAMPMALG